MGRADASMASSTVRSRAATVFGRRRPPSETRDDSSAIAGHHAAGWGPGSSPPKSPRRSPRGSPRSAFPSALASSPRSTRLLLLVASSAWLACQLGMLRWTMSGATFPFFPWSRPSRRTQGSLFRPWDTESSYRRAVEGGKYTGPFDVVYLWANATEEWSSARNEVKRKLGRPDKTAKGADTNPWSPTRDNDELRLSLRSVEKNLPWVRNVYILSNGQRPAWIVEDHPRIRFVDTDELVGRLGGKVPNFNSHAIYLASAFIEGLSEIYVSCC